MSWSSLCFFFFLFFFVCVFLCFFFFSRGFFQADINWNKSPKPQETRKEAKALKLSSPLCCAGGDRDGGMQGWRCRALQPAASSDELGLGPVPGSVSSLHPPSLLGEMGSGFPISGEQDKGT